MYVIGIGPENQNSKNVENYDYDFRHRNIGFDKEGYENFLAGAGNVVRQSAFHGSINSADLLYHPCGKEFEMWRIIRHHNGSVTL